MLFLNLVFSLSCAYHVLESSNPSRDFIVNTNEKQWAETYGNILSSQLFGTSSEVTRVYLSNFLQEAYLVGTRQSHVDPARPLW